MTSVHIRAKDGFAPAGTPYYVGKGRGRRVYSTAHSVHPPKDKSLIKIFPMLNEEEAFASEIAMIELFGRQDNGTGILRNRTNGGDGASGYIASEEARRKISERNKGRRPTEETRRKLREASKGNQHNLGHKHTKESICKMSDIVKKRPPFSEEHCRHISETRKRLDLKPSKETRQRMREAHKGNKNTRGHKLTEEHRRKLCTAGKGNQNARGHKHTEESRRKMSKTRKGHEVTEETRRKMRESAKLWFGHKQLLEAEAIT